MSKCISKVSNEDDDALVLLCQYAFIFNLSKVDYKVSPGHFSYCVLRESILPLFLRFIDWTFELWRQSDLFYSSFIAIIVCKKNRNCDCFMWKWLFRLCLAKVDIWVRIMVLYVTFNNISVISWRSVLLEKKRNRSTLWKSQTCRKSLKNLIT